VMLNRLLCHAKPGPWLTGPAETQPRSQVSPIPWLGLP
jgi:hypothetical protein